MPPPTPDHVQPAPALPSTAITPLPTAFQPRRKRSRRTPLHPLKRRRTTASDASASAEDAAFEQLSSISDTRVAVLALREQWPHQATISFPHTPPIILRSQIHALVADTSAVDRHLSDMLHERFIRRITLPSARTDLRRDAYVIVDDLRSRLANPSPVLTALLDDVFAACIEPIVDQVVLTDVYGTQHVETAINELVRNGFLTMHSENSFWFAVPGMADFLRNRDAGETQILRLLKKAPYKEMQLPTLELRTLKSTVFTAQWHLRDLVGSGVADSIDTSVGTIIRLSLMRPS